MHALLLGARGYVGSTLLHILLRHRNIETITLSSDTSAGMPVHRYEPNIHATFIDKIDHQQCYVSTREILKNRIDSKYSIVFSALPHGILAKQLSTMYALDTHKEKKATVLPLQRETAMAQTNKNTHTVNNASKNTDTIKPNLIIDLSADFRLKQKEHYIQYYNNEHPLPSFLPNAIYGLSEWYRQSINSSKPPLTIIATPGDYSTSILLPLLPVMRNCNVDGLIHMHAISGTLGTDCNVKEHLLFSEYSENISAYSPGLQHRHVPEIQQCITELSGESKVPFMFSPHLAPLVQGMFSTISVPLISRQEVQRAKESLYAQYLDENFIQVCDTEAFGTKDVHNTNTALIYAHCEDNCIILHCAIDALWKGSAGQAVQNCNIYFGFDEHEGLV